MELGCNTAQLRLLMFGEYPMTFVTTFYTCVQGKSSPRTFAKYSRMSKRKKLTSLCALKWLHCTDTAENEMKTALSYLNCRRV